MLKLVPERIGCNERRKPGIGIHASAWKAGIGSERLHNLQENKRKQGMRITDENRLEKRTLTPRLFIFGCCTTPVVTR